MTIERLGGPSPMMRHLLEGRYEIWSDWVLDHEFDTMIFPPLVILGGIPPGLRQAMRERAELSAFALAHGGDPVVECTADEILLRAVAADVVAEFHDNEALPDDIDIWDGDAEVTPEDIQEWFTEDTDVEILFDLSLDGAADDPDLAEELGYTNLAVDEWFVPFRGGVK